MKQIFPVTCYAVRQRKPSNRESTRKVKNFEKCIRMRMAMTSTNKKGPERPLEIQDDLFLHHHCTRWTKRVSLQSGKIPRTECIGKGKSRQRTTRQQYNSGWQQHRNEYNETIHNHNPLYRTDDHCQNVMIDPTEVSSEGKIPLIPSPTFPAFS